MTLSDDEIRKLQELAAKATPGPWMYDDETAEVFSPKTGSILGGQIEICESAEDNDGPFIAAAREGVPALIATADQLRVDLAQAQAAREVYISQVIPTIEALQVARVVVEAARQALWVASRAGTAAEKQLRLALEAYDAKNAADPAPFLAKAPDGEDTVRRLGIDVKSWAEEMRERLQTVAHMFAHDPETAEVKAWLAQMPDACLAYWKSQGCDGHGMITVGGDDVQGYALECPGCGKCQ